MFTFDDIQTARERITPYVRRTVIDHSDTLSRELGAQIYLKLELFQKAGSFKPRGAFNQILNLTQEERQRGVVAVSGGNFAQGVAYAGRELGVSTLICMPAYTPQNYLEATRGYGAQIEIAPSIQAAFDQAEAHHLHGRKFLHPYDDPYQMAGCGTLGLELLEDLPELTDVFVSIGGGGLIAGVTAAIKALKPEARVWGVETEGADSMGQALAAGRVVQITPTSLARTLGAPNVAEDSLRLMQKHLEDHVLVSDREAFEAQVFLLERAKVNTELASSCTLAAARRLKARFHPNDRIVLVLCGGNNSLDNLIEYRRLLAESSSGSPKG